MTHWYIWDKKSDKVIPETDLLKAAQAFADDRSLKKTVLPDGKLVSTVFLGLDHGFGDGPPLLWETMVFPSADDFSELYQERYTTKEQALVGHDKAVSLFTENTAPPQPE